jgi:hypothetical protein
MACKSTESVCSHSTPRLFGDMTAGKSFFVTPSDSVALIAASAAEAIPYFKGGLKVLHSNHTASGHLQGSSEGSRRLTQLLTL